MPELPEVETTRQGISPFIVGEVVKKIVLRERQLRWPIPTGLKRSLKNQLITKLNHCLFNFRRNLFARLRVRGFDVHSHDIFRPGRTNESSSVVVFDT